MSPRGDFQDAVSLLGSGGNGCVHGMGFQPLSLKQMTWGRITKELVELLQQQHKQATRLSTVSILI